MATIGSTFGANSVVRTMLREGVGHPDETVLLPDAMVDRVMARALARLNQDRPAESLGSFVTVADQGAYTPLPSGSYAVLDVQWPKTQCIDFLASPGYIEARSLFEAFSTVIDEDGTRVLPDPALVAIVVRKISWLRHFDSSGATIIDRRTVHLDPVPTGASTAFFRYLTQRYASVGAVADDDMDRFFAIGEHFLHARLATGAGAIGTLSDGNTGNTIRTEAPERHETAAAARLADYEASLPPIPIRLW